MSRNMFPKVVIVTIALMLPNCSFAQKQLLKTAVKDSKSLFKTEAKSLAKEGAEAANKAILKDAFKTGSEEIGKNYVEKASAKQLLRREFRKCLLKEIEEKEVGSILRYGTLTAGKELKTIDKSVVKSVALKESRKVDYAGRVSELKNKVLDKFSETLLSLKVKNTLIYKELVAILDKGAISLSEKEFKYLLENPKQLRNYIKIYCGDNKKFQEFFIRLSMGNKKQTEVLLDNPIIKDWLSKAIRRSGEGHVHEWLMTKNFKDFLINPKWGEDGPFLALSLTKLVQKTENVLFKTGGGHVSANRVNSAASSAFHNGLSEAISKCSSKEEVFVAVKRYAKDHLTDEAYKEFETIFAGVFKQV